MSELPNDWMATINSTSIVSEETIGAFTITHKEYMTNIIENYGSLRLFKEGTEIEIHILYYDGGRFIVQFNPQTRTIVREFGMFTPSK